MGMAVAEKFHVLAVDDSVIDRKLIERLLKTSSYQVTTVDSGSKALEFLGFEEQSNISPPSVSPNSENHRHQKDEQVSVSPRIKKAVGVNLVITDYCMPGMTGYDLLKKIKESSSLRNIPVVIMSSENVPSRISRCLEEGAEEFFLKPVRLSDVNKLKPHMLKAMYDDGDQSNEGTSVDNLHKPELLQQQPPEEQQPTEAQQSQQPQQQQSNSGSNKRKSVEANSSTQITVEEGLSPDRTRPRYSGLAVV